MLPRALCLRNSRFEGDAIVPLYLTQRDELWLQALIGEHTRYVGRKRRDLQDRLREPLGVSAPKAKLRVAAHVLDGMTRDWTVATVAPRKARWAVFCARAIDAAPRALVLERVAESLDLSPADLEIALFADLRSERRVLPLPEEFSPGALAQESNAAMVAALLRCALEVRITVWGAAPALARHARGLGLICNISGAERAPASPFGRVTLTISGPFALFKRTQVYANALASLLPRVASCENFEIEALCAQKRGRPPRTLVVRSSDPIAPGACSGTDERRIEALFAKDFAAAAPDWELLRQPLARGEGSALVMPDFELVHRGSRCSWFVEIVGFWTRESLLEKRHQLRAAGLERYILCIDEKRCCGEPQVPEGLRVVRYRTRIDPAAVLRTIAA